MGKCRANSLPEKRDQPHEERKSDAQDDAGHNRKIKRPVPAADGDVAGQTSEAQGQTAPEQQERAEGEQNQSAEDQPFCEFTGRVHVLPACPGKHGSAPPLPAIFVSAHSKEFTSPIL